MPPPRDRDELVARCVTAAEEADAVGALREVLAEAVADLDALDRALGDLTGTDGTLHRAPGLTVQVLALPPAYRTGIHDHTVPALVGTTAGREDNELYRRVGDRGRLEAAGGRRCGPGDVLVLDRHAVHEVVGAGRSWSKGVHIYLGDLRSLARSQWPAADAEEEPYDGPSVIARWRAAIGEAGGHP